MHTILKSFIRTAVPVAVGQVVAWLALINVALSADAQTGLSTFLGGLITAVYYLVVRWLENHVSWFGWLLGLAQAPDSYSNPRKILHPPARETAPDFTGDDDETNVLLEDGDFTDGPTQ